GDVVQVSHMVGRLIAVHIVADDALPGNVFGMGKELVGKVHGEQRIEVARKPTFASHRVHPPSRVVGHVEAVVPGVALEQSLPVGFEYVERLSESSDGMPWTHEANRGIV